MFLNAIRLTGFAYRQGLLLLTLTAVGIVRAQTVGRHELNRFAAAAITAGQMNSRILIVDDSAIFRGDLRAMLETHNGWEVCEAGNGMEGVEKARQLAPDFVVMDMSMPYMTGIEAASEILREFPNVPIVLLTLYNTRQLAEEARKTGIRATLSKTDAEHLSSGIEAVLRGGEFSAPGQE